MSQVELVDGSQEESWGNTELSLIGLASSWALSKQWGTFKGTCSIKLHVASVSVWFNG